MKSIQDLFATNTQLFQVHMADDHLLLFSNVLEAVQHTHRFLHLVVCLEAGCDEQLLTIDKNPLVCAAAIVNSDVEHTFQGKNTKHAIVLIDQTSHLADCLKAHFLPDNAAYYLFPQEAAAQLRQAFLSFPASPATPLTYHTAWERALTTLALAQCSLLHSHHDERIDELLFLLKHSKSLQHSIKSLAERVHLSPSRLSHLFKEHTGGTLKNYLLIKQLLMALLSIASGNSATKAALDAGFDSPSHLSSTCKRLLGIQPSELRKVSAFLKVSLFH